MDKTITLLLTENCNLSCVYCYEKHKGGKTMAFATAIRLLEEFFQKAEPTDRITIDFFGGEPFMAFPRMKEIVEYVEEDPKSIFRNIPHQFFATTNGTLIHGAIQDWICTHPYFRLGLSLDGNPTMQNVNRSNSFDKIDLDFFRKSYPGQPVKMTISDKTLEYLADGVIFCHEQGFEVLCNLAYGIDWADPVYLNRLSSQMDALIEYYLAHPKQKPCSLLDRKVEFAAIEPDMHFTKKWCGTGTAMTTFDAEGKQYPCQLFMPVSGGNEKAESALNLAFSDKIDVQLLPEKCRNCITREICPTCYGSNYLSSGNIYQKDDALCNLEKLTFYANACFMLRKWDAGLLADKDDAYLTAVLAGAKKIIKEYKPDKI